MRNRGIETAQGRINQNEVFELRLSWGGTRTKRSMYMGSRLEVGKGGIFLHQLNRVQKGYKWIHIRKTEIKPGVENVLGSQESNCIWVYASG